MLHDRLHPDRQMTFIINAFPVADHQYLRGFVPDIKILGYFFGDCPVSDQIQEIKIHRGGNLGPLQPASHDLAGPTAGAMFKYNLGP
jgi:hypothetical protein